MPIIAAHGIQKTYGTRVVLAGVDLTLRTGERVGVIGANGSGKSTLARILAGLSPPDQGTLSQRRGTTIGYLSQVPEFDAGLSAEQALLESLSGWSRAVARHEAATRSLAQGVGDQAQLLSEQHAAQEEVERLGGWDQKHRAAALLNHVGITRPEADVSTLSGGEQRRVALARLLLSRPDLAILDEPTNHLDAETIEWLESYLLDEYPGAALLITHDRYLLDRVAERTLEVVAGRVYSYDGGYELYLEQKAQREELAARTEQNRQNFLRTELEWLRRQPKARTTKQKARIERAEAAKTQPKPFKEETAKFELETARSGKTVLELRELGLSIGGRELCRSLTLFLPQGQIVGVVGRNGTGKTTLLRAITGETPPSSGQVQLGQNTKIAYFDQQRSSLDDGKSVLENVAGDQSRIEVGGQFVEPRSYLERFGFDVQRQRQPVGSLSGGERARVALAKMLRFTSNLVLLDEPTNDLDVGTLGALENMLLESHATALVVTHDRWFLDRVASSILAFEGDGKVTLYPGNYETFRRLQKEAREQQAKPAPDAAAAPRSKPSPSPNEPKKPKRLNRAEEQELSALPDAIERAEAAVQAQNLVLSDPATHAGGGEAVLRATAELSRAEAEVARLMQRWEELEEKKATAS
ncbi:MAG TPA: ABC-F family ATP-binding cassette domain-containing protein [Polyangiaceae bacterium]|nr:ABC-F family ATP-binding cassette domain-containing protein [Polyangiaceae bacterium]